MTIKVAVSRHYERLTEQLGTEISRAAVPRSAIFPEWANGRVLLDAETVVRLRTGRNEKLSDGDFLRSVYEAFLEVNEPRMIPALTFDKNIKLVVVLVLQP